MVSEKKLSQYADVIVQVGLNVQPGQKVVISAPIEMVELVRLVTARAYAAGALDPNTGNNSASQSITIQQADVYINKSADTLTPFVNDNVVFTIVAGNPAQVVRRHDGDAWQWMAPRGPA